MPAENTVKMSELEARMQKIAQEVVDKATEANDNKSADALKAHLKEQLPHFLSDAAKDEKIRAALFSPANDDLPTEFKASRAIRCALHALRQKGGIDEAVEAAKKHFPDQAGYVEKALGTTSDGVGGVTIAEDVLDDFRPALRPQTVFRKLGARVVPMPTGDARLPIATAGASAVWEDESTGVNASQMTTDKRDLEKKELVVITAVANALLLQSSVDVDAFVLLDQRRAIAIAEDSAFIRGAVASKGPTGVRFLTAAGNITATAGASAANMETDIYALISALGEADIDMTNAGFMMSYRTFLNLKKARESAGGNRIFEELRSGSPNADTREGLPRLEGYPVGVTNTIPTNLGAGTNESEIYFGNFDDYIIGETSGITIDVSNEAAYLDNTGTMRSAFANRETVMRTMLREDGAQRYTGSFAVKTGVAY